MARSGRPAGRPPVPAELKLIRGTRRRRETTEGEAKTAPPRAPTGLGRTGSRAWRLYWTHGIAWLAETDKPLVERLCRLIDDAAQLRATIEAEGLTVTNRRTKRSHVHALYNSLLGLDKQITSLEAACGFTPTDRARLGVRAASSDPLSRWEAGVSS